MNYALEHCKLSSLVIAKSEVIVVRFLLPFHLMVGGMYLTIWINIVKFSEVFLQVLLVCALAFSLNRRRFKLCTFKLAISLFRNYSNVTCDVEGHLLKRVQRSMD